MHIACYLSPATEDAIGVWLNALDHSVKADSEVTHRLVTDYQHLHQLSTSLAPSYWLLIDSQLSTTQTLQALQLGCGYISTAPLDKTTLEHWLTATDPLPDMLALDSHAPLPSVAIDSRLGSFVDLVTQGIWPAEQQQQAKQLLPYRDIALALPQFINLQQDGQLSSLQQAQLACHTLAGHILLAQHGLHAAAQVALQHHEHYDGSGYPKQLQGDAIEPIARLAKLYDAYTGLRKEKVYAQAVSHELAVQKLQFGDGYLWPTQFDPQLLSHFITHQGDIDSLFAS